MDGYERLAQAIVKSAADEWRKGMEIIKHDPDSVRAARMVKDAEKFFLSDWCNEISPVPGEKILILLRKELEDEC